MALGWKDFLPSGEEITALHEQIREGLMIHALLISGESGFGKKSLANLVAETLLCRGEGEKPCGRCNGCLMAQKQEHPDFLLIERGRSLTGVPPKNKTAIPVGEIREVIRQSSAWPFEGGNRVILINHAEDMNAQAQNCLLKILEEPPANTYFILTAVHPDQLLTTVRSRCRSLKMKPWKEEELTALLTGMGIGEQKARAASRAARGSVGTAVRLSSDDEYWKARDEIINAFFKTRSRSEILKVSNLWKDRKQESDLLFDTLEEAVRALIAYRLDREQDAVRDFPEEWKKFALETDFSGFSSLLDRISESRKECSFNVNFQAVFEQLMLSFIGMI